MQDRFKAETLVSGEITGVNAAYVEALYEAYLKDPSDCSPSWRAYFDGLPPLGDDGHQQDLPHSTVQEHFRLLAKNQSRVVPASAACTAAIIGANAASAAACAATGSW